MYEGSFPKMSNTQTSKRRKGRIVKMWGKEMKKKWRGRPLTSLPRWISENMSEAQPEACFNWHKHKGNRKSKSERLSHWENLLRLPEHQRKYWAKSDRKETSQIHIRGKGCRSIFVADGYSPFFWNSSFKSHQWKWILLFTVLTAKLRQTSKSRPRKSL